MAHRTPVANNAVSIRPVQDSETGALSELIHDTMDRSLGADYTAAELEQMKRSFTPEGVARKLQGAEAFVATGADGSLAGVAARIPHESHPTASRLRTLFVAPHLQGTGLGRTLAELIEERARAASDVSIRLGSTRTALPFYRHRGYVVIEQPGQEPGQQPGPQPPLYLQMGKHLHARIRPEQPGDAEQIRAVIRDAFQSFGGGEVEVALVDRLRHEASPFVSLVAEIGGRVVGHIALSPMVAPRQAFALGPVGVSTSEQGGLLGTQLCRAGMAACAGHGAGMVFLLGHVDFYPRLGFRSAGALGFSFRGEAPPALMVATPAGEPPTGVKGEPLQFHPAFDDV